MPPNRFESEVGNFLEGSHGDRTHIKRAGHHTVTPLCGTLLGRLLGEFYTGLARRVSCGESFVPEVVLCAVQSSPCSACWWIERYKVLPASEKWLGIAVLWCVGRVLSRVGPSGPPAGRVLYRFGPPGFVWGEFCPGWVHRGRLLGEFYTGSARRVSCGESFVPQVVLCAVQSSPCSACLCRRREEVLPASEKWLGIAVLWCVGRVLSRVGPSGPPAGRVLYRFDPPGFRVGRVLSRLCI